MRGRIPYTAVVRLKSTLVLLALASLAPVVQAAPPQTTEDGVVVQRPGGAPTAADAPAPTPASTAAEPSAEPSPPESAESPTPLPSSDPSPEADAGASAPDAGSPALYLGDLGRVQVQVLAADTGHPETGLSLSIQCLSCGDAPLYDTTASQGVASFEGLVPGTYLLTIERGDDRFEKRVTVEGGQTRDLRYALPRPAYRPKTTDGRLNHTGWSANPTHRGAQIPLAIGGVLIAVGGGCGVGAAVEYLTPECNYDSCDGGPRPNVAGGLIACSAIAATGGIIALTTGAVRLHRLRYGAAPNRKGASVGVSFQF